MGQSLGLSGILNGQACDLRFAESSGERSVLEVATGKTVSLVRLSLLLPALVGGAGAEVTARLDRLATVWGLSYQILDDFKDCVMSRGEAGKSTSRDVALKRPNLPLHIGWNRALQRVTELMGEARTLLDSLDDLPRACPTLHRLQDRLEQECRAISARLAAASS